MCSAATRSACPSASVRQASTSRQWRFSISPCPMKHSFVSLPLPLRYSRASGSVVEAWVSFERFWPWKSASALRPPPCAGGSPEPSFRLDALHRGPGFDQRAIDREVIARQKLLYLGLRQHRREELGRD